MRKFAVVVFLILGCAAAFATFNVRYQNPMTPLPEAAKQEAIGSEEFNARYDLPSQSPTLALPIPTPRPQHEPVAPIVPEAPQGPIGKADLVKVDKSERLMQLLRDDNVIASYKIALGRSPEGHKWQEGDMRTPEGRYIIDWRNPKSGYFLSLHISYPNEEDKAHARDAGVSPGGMIMIHGQPNGYGMAASVLQTFDWTYGCIAVTNQEMQQIWDAVPDGTPIEISP
ncbi:MAG: L,D-transpeptidase family protein [Rhizobiaceae bacterium]